MKIKILIILLILLSFSDDVFSGAWTQKQGKGFFQISSHVIRTNEYHDPGGITLTIPTLGEYVVSFFGEFGLTDDLSVVGYIPFFKGITLNRLVGQDSGFEYFGGDSNSGFADFDIGLKYKLFNVGSTVITGRLSFGIPVGDSEQPNGLLTGDGELNQSISILAGHSFYPLPFYTSGGIGFNNRINGYSDEFIYYLEFGLNVTKNFLITFKINGVETLRNGDDNVTGGTSGLYANDQRYLNFGPVLSYSIFQNFGITGGVYTATRVQNALSGYAYQFGIFYTM